MNYFLKKTTPAKKGLYLQIYVSTYIPGKGKRNRCHKTLGYVCDLVEKGIEDPVAHFQKEVDRLNADLRMKKTVQAGDERLHMNLGYFLPKAMFDLLNIDDDINAITYNFKTRYKFSDMLRALCCAQIIAPGSKYKAFEKVIPSMYGTPDFSYDQILDAVEFIGSDYHKFIEVLNHHIERRWKRSLNKVYFDCTNYYFEIDMETDLLRKGPSKENRREPILGQALMLDADQIPLDTEFYPGNESEKPYLRKRIEDMKERNNVTGRVIQVADKGINCARNVYAAVKEANDGYIFSKSLKGTGLSAKEKEWALCESSDNINSWTDVRDTDGSLTFRYKVAKSIDDHGKLRDYDTFLYKCRINPEDSCETEFSVREKRIVIFNPKLAEKQRAEIYKQVEKLKNSLSMGKILRDTLGDSAKYVNITAENLNGEKVKVAASLNYDKVYEELRYAGYNMLVTSETHVDPVKIYKTYHNLWRIEESFRVMKTQLEARPVYLSKNNSILGHFLIVYMALTIMRLLELKTFRDKVPISKLFEFVREYNITKNIYGDVFTNCCMNKELYNTVKNYTGIARLGNAFLTKRDVNLLLETDIDI